MFGIRFFDYYLLLKIKSIKFIILLTIKNMLLMFQNNKDENVRALNNVDAFTCAVGVDDYTMYSKSSSLQVKFIFLDCLVYLVYQFKL